MPLVTERYVDKRHIKEKIYGPRDRHDIDCACNFNIAFVHGIPTLILNRLTSKASRGMK